MANTVAQFLDGDRPPRRFQQRGVPKVEEVLKPLFDGAVNGRAAAKWRRMFGFRLGPRGARGARGDKELIILNLQQQGSINLADPGPPALIVTGADLSAIGSDKPGSKGLSTGTVLAGGGQGLFLVASIGYCGKGSGTYAVGGRVPAEGAQRWASKVRRNMSESKWESQPSVTGDYKDIVRIFAREVALFLRPVEMRPSRPGGFASFGEAFEEAMHFIFPVYTQMVGSTMPMPRLIARKELSAALLDPPAGSVGTGGSGGSVGTAGSAESAVLEEDSATGPRAAAAAPPAAAAAPPAAAAAPPAAAATPGPVADITPEEHWKDLASSLTDGSHGGGTSYVWIFHDAWVKSEGCKLVFKVLGWSKVDAERKTYEQLGRPVLGDDRTKFDWVKLDFGPYYKYDLTNSRFTALKNNPNKDRGVYDFVPVKGELGNYYVYSAEFITQWNMQVIRDPGDWLSKDWRRYEFNQYVLSRHLGIKDVREAWCGSVLNRALRKNQVLLDIWLHTPLLRRMHRERRCIVWRENNYSEKANDYDIENGNLNEELESDMPVLTFNGTDASLEDILTRLELTAGVAHRVLTDEMKRFVPSKVVKKDKSAEEDGDEDEDGDSDEDDDGMLDDIIDRDFPLGYGMSVGWNKVKCEKKGVVNFLKERAAIAMYKEIEGAAPRAPDVVVGYVSGEVFRNAVGDRLPWTQAAVLDDLTLLQQSGMMVNAQISGMHTFIGTYVHLLMASTVPPLPDLPDGFRAGVDEVELAGANTFLYGPAIGAEHISDVPASENPYAECRRRMNNAGGGPVDGAKYTRLLERPILKNAGAGGIGVPYLHKDLAGVLAGEGVEGENSTLVARAKFKKMFERMYVLPNDDDLKKQFLKSQEFKIIATEYPLVHPHCLFQFGKHGEFRFFSTQIDFIATSRTFVIPQRASYELVVGEYKCLMEPSSPLERILDPTSFAQVYTNALLLQMQAEVTVARVLLVFLTRRGLAYSVTASMADLHAESKLEAFRADVLLCPRPGRTSGHGVLYFDGSTLLGTGGKVADRLQAANVDQIPQLGNSFGPTRAILKPSRGGPPARWPYDPMDPADKVDWLQHMQVDYRGLNGRDPRLHSSQTPALVVADYRPNIPVLRDGPSFPRGLAGSNRPDKMRLYDPKAALPRGTYFSPVTNIPEPRMWETDVSDVLAKAIKAELANPRHGEVLAGLQKLDKVKLDKHMRSLDIYEVTVVKKTGSTDVRRAVAAGRLNPKTDFSTLNTVDHILCQTILCMVNYLVYELAPRSSLDFADVSTFRDLRTVMRNPRSVAEQFHLNVRGRATASDDDVVVKTFLANSHSVKWHSAVIHWAVTCVPASVRAVVGHAHTMEP